MAQVDATRTDQGTFSTQHTFAQFYSQFLISPPAVQIVYSPDIEIGKLSGRTSGRAASAIETSLEGGFFLFQSMQTLKAFPVYFQGSGFRYTKSE